MGHYSNLTIDDLFFSWKYQIPAFLTFLFAEEDYYCEFEETGDPDEPRYIGQIGYRTTCDKSLATLDTYGYTMEFFSEVYGFFRDDLKDYFESRLQDELTDRLERTITEDEFWQGVEDHLGSYPSVTKERELDDFVKFLAAVYRTDFRKPPFDEPVEMALGDGRKYRVGSEEYLRARRYSDTVRVDFEALQMYILHKYTKFPPWILMIAGLFDESYVTDYPEILSLMFVRLALEAVRPSAEIKLDLVDICETEEEVRSLREDLAESLVQKVSLYNRAFRVLFAKEKDMRTTYIKAQCAELLRETRDAVSSHDKGRSLERLVEVLFTSNELLELVDKRVSTEDEEIDLVIKNNVDRPFWMALASPLFFVECKNWASSVGPKELRDFEMKLQNHAPLAKVGFLVSLNGFTGGVDAELKRAGRSPYHVVTLDGDDLDSFAVSDGGFFDWLEARVARLR